MAAEKRAGLEGRPGGLVFLLSTRACAKTTMRAWRRIKCRSSLAK